MLYQPMRIKWCDWNSNSPTSITQSCLSLTPLEVYLLWNCDRQLGSQLPQEQNDPQVSSEMAKWAVEIEHHDENCNVFSHKNRLCHYKIWMTRLWIIERREISHDFNFELLHLLWNIFFLFVPERVELNLNELCFSLSNWVMTKVSFGINLSWMPLESNDENSTLVLDMVEMLIQIFVSMWCHWATTIC